MEPEKDTAGTLLDLRCACCGTRRLWSLVVESVALLVCYVCDLEPARD